MSEVKKEIELEIAYVLFVDIVGYSKLLITEQRERLETLNQIVRNTAQFRSSDAHGMLVRIPTGDGMALIFRDTVEAPLRCAVEVSQAIKIHREIQIRMGIHSERRAGSGDSGSEREAPGVLQLSRARRTVRTGRRNDSAVGSSSLAAI